MPAQLSPMSGPSDGRPRAGLSPRTAPPLAGMRSAPPPRVPARLSRVAGPSDGRPRDGFSPTGPPSLAGRGIEPPPSFACAAGTMPEATAAADPPLDPPGERPTSHGLRVGPYASGSV